MYSIINETIRKKMEMKKDILQEIEELRMVWPSHERKN
jgi:hypothetical protein